MTHNSQDAVQDVDVIARYEAVMERLRDAADGLNGLNSRMKAADLEAAADAADALGVVLEHAAATWPARLRALSPQLTVEQFYQIVYYIDAGYVATDAELATHAAKKDVA